MKAADWHYDKNQREWDENAHKRAEILSGIRRGLMRKAAFNRAGYGSHIYVAWTRHAAKGLEPYATFFDEIERVEAEQQLDWVEEVHSIAAGEEKTPGRPDARVMLSLLARRHPEWNEDARRESEQYARRAMETIAESGLPEEVQLHVFRALSIARDGASGGESRAAEGSGGGENGSLAPIETPAEPAPPD